MVPEPHFSHRPWHATLGVALASVVATVVVPSAIITAYAMANRDPAAITMFALAIAEPAAVASALAVVLSFPSRRGWISGLVRGGGAAAAVVAAALWTGDVDMWTAVSAALLPMSGIAATWIPRSTARDALQDATASAPGQPAPPASLDAGTAAVIDPVPERVEPVSLPR